MSKYVLIFINFYFRMMKLLGGLPTTGSGNSNWPEYVLPSYSSRRNGTFSAGGVVKRTFMNLNQLHTIYPAFLQLMRLGFRRISFFLKCPLDDERRLDDWTQLLGL
jgi:hypothetical protein